MVYVLISVLLYLFSILLCSILLVPLPCYRKRWLPLHGRAILVVPRPDFSGNRRLLGCLYPLPLPAPPRVDKQPSSALAAPEAGSPIDSDKPAADKFAALKAYRRTRGLCDRCAERWRPGHKCAPSVQLHVVQELIDLLQVSNLDADLSPPHTEAVSDHGGSLAEGQLFIALSAEALAGSDGPRTMRFEGTILDIPLLILVDSGSSHSFLSSAVAAQLPGVQQLSDAISVQVANGNVMLCSTHLPAAVWKIQNYHFSSDLRILPLQHFDLILGMDWLESFSPMKVHWKLKWLSIPYQNSTILLQGILH